MYQLKYADLLKQLSIVTFPNILQSTHYHLFSSPDLRHIIIMANPEFSLSATHASAGPTTTSTVQQSLTQHLLDLDPTALRHATHATFLTKASTNSLPADIARSWLAQDRLYALSYTNFVAQLLAKVKIPSSSKRTETLEWRIADALIGCLTNIKTEVKLFEDVAASQGWSATLDETVPNEATVAYRNLFAGAAQPSASLLVGLVTLWGTEECYLRAWSAARENLPGRVSEDDVFGTTFIPNWSSEEFKDVVKILADLVDGLGKGVSAEEKRACEEVWRAVLRVEREFWPEV